MTAVIWLTIHACLSSTQAGLRRLFSRVVKLNNIKTFFIDFFCGLDLRFLCVCVYEEAKLCFSTALVLLLQKTILNLKKFYFILLFIFQNRHE